MVFEGEGLNSVSGIPANKIDALRSATRKFLNRHLYPSRWALLLPQHQVEIETNTPNSKPKSYISIERCKTLGTCPQCLLACGR